MDRPSLGVTTFLFVFSWILSFPAVAQGRSQTLVCPTGGVVVEGPAELGAAARVRGVSPVARWCEKDGKREGLYREYFPNGSAYRDIEYRAGQRAGIYRGYDQDGNVVVEGQYENGHRTGRWRDYAGTQVVAEYTYTIRDGVEWSDGVNYFADGLKASKGSRRAGQMHGPFESWHPGGQISSRGDYVDGLQAGPWTFWYPDGKLQSQGEFADGKKVGVWKEWSEDGTVRTTIPE